MWVVVAWIFAGIVVTAIALVLWMLVAVAKSDEIWGESDE